MGICAAKLDTTTPEGKLQYIFQHFDEDKDSYFSSAEYITFCGKMGNKMFDPDGWEEALAEYGQGWVCDGSGGIPFDGILMMCTSSRLCCNRAQLLLQLLPQPTLRLVLSQPQLLPCA
tara:strand:- start:252 stop:605 length:354 start_codon:yes stop_codon:yes gene_type:complete